MADDVIGRASEIAEVLGALSRGPVLVCGPAGIGKTTVLQAAAARWAGPVSWLRLPPGSGDDAWGALRAHLEVPADGSLPRALAARPDLLLVVDDADGLSPLTDLRSPGRGAAVLVGGRVRSNEVRSVLLGPLALEHAARVYLAAARQVAPELRPDPKLVRELCRLLEGWPLGLALAGRRIRTLPPDAPGLVAALTRSVAGVFDEVTASLAPAERGALREAAVFERTFDLAAFEAVVGADGEVLERLLDGGLVATDAAGGLHLPALLREHLVHTHPPGELLRQRHATWLVEEGARRRNHWRRTGDAGPLEALRSELRTVAGVGSLPAACLVAELGLRRGPLVDPFGPPPPATVAVAAMRSRILRRQLRPEAALTWLEQAPVPADPVEAAILARERVHTLLALGRGTEADLLLPTLQAPAPPEQAAESALVEAVLHQRHGRTDRAIAALRAAIAVVDASELPELRARVSAHLGAMLRTTDPDAAVRWLRSALDFARSVGDLRWQGIVGGWLGVQLHDRGEGSAASEVLGEAARTAALAGVVPYEVQARIVRSAVFLEQGAVAAARAELAAAEALGAMTAVGEASLRGHQGLLEARDGNPGRALPFLRGARERYAALGAWSSAATWAALAAQSAAAAGGDPAVDLGHLQEATARAPDPALAQVLAEVLAGAVSPGARALGAGRADLRMLVALADQAAVTVDRSGHLVTLRDGSRISLESRPTLTRLLAALAAAGPGVEVSRDELLARGWPGQKLVGSSGQARLHVAISTLRKSGVPLVTAESPAGLAYALDPTVRVT
jgi:hypothetical protein